MIRLAIVPIALLVWIAGLLAAENQANETVNWPQGATFTGIHRTQHARGPETVTITDGKTFIILSEEEYRAGGYRPFYEMLPTVIVQRLPVQIPLPKEEKVRKR